MKTIKLLLLVLLAMNIALLGCKKYEDEGIGVSQNSNDPALKITRTGTTPVKPWTEDFSSPQSLTENWKLYGTPQPKWKSEAFDKSGLFDNNGPSPTKNFAVSRFTIGNGEGYTVESEIYLKILSYEGTCVCPGIAVSRDKNPVMKDGDIESGISIRLIYAGESATWFPPASRGHAWLAMGYIADRQDVPERQSVVKTLVNKADQYCNGWHRIKLVVTPSRNLLFYIDNTLAWAPEERISESMIADKNVILGYTSSGDPSNRAGVAYHNWVKSSYLISQPIN